MSNQPNPNSTPVAPLHKTAGDAVEGSYIVVLKDGVNKSEHLGNLPQNVRGECEVTNHEWTVLNGYPAKLSQSAVQALRSHQDVKYIEEDSVVSIDDGDC